MKYINIILILLLSFFNNSFSQIKVAEQTSSNAILIGKISHTSAFQSSGLSRKLPIVDGLKLANDPEKIKIYKVLKKEANEVFSSIGIRKMDFVDADFSASLIYLRDRNKYLLTFLNSEYNYQNESFWISEQTKKELYELIDSELNKKIKFKNIEVVLDNQVVLVISINRKKISFNLWDGYSWVQSYWYRHFKIRNLFGENS
tara:strand:+ start:1291 stop:1896 length:606 start_codon:yes stop_codon:yes gene_type:complete